MAQDTSPITKADFNGKKDFPVNFIFENRISSVRIDALLLSRKLTNIRDDLEQGVASAVDNTNPMHRDLIDVQDDADHILKLLENMDNRLSYIQENQKRLKIRSDYTTASQSH